MALKKLGSAGRFGARYGRRLKRKISDVEAIQKSKHKCPFCIKSGGVKRVASGIWYCRTCGAKYAGRAYEPGVKSSGV